MEHIAGEPPRRAAIDHASQRRSCGVLSRYAYRRDFFRPCLWTRILRPLRIERLNLPARAAFKCPWTRRQREAVRNDCRVGRQRSARVTDRLAGGSTRAGRIWCQSAAIESRLPHPADPSSLTRTLVSLPRSASVADRVSRCSTRRVNGDVRQRQRASTTFALEIVCKTYRSGKTLLSDVTVCLGVIFYQMSRQAGHRTGQC